MFGKNKKSILLLLMFFFWVGYVSFTGYQFYTQASKLTEHLNATRQANLDYILQSSVGALIQEHPAGVHDKLSQARKLRFVDFFILQKGDQPLFFENNTGNIAELNHNYANFNVFIDTNGLKFKTIKVMDYRLTAGIYADVQGTIWGTFKNMLPLFIKDIFIVTLLLGLVAYTVLKDILNLSRVLASRERSNISNIKTRSAEGETLLRASLGLEGERLRLEKLSEVYGETVGPAIRHELQSGKAAPYSFSATLCRVDLNGYTQIFLEKDDKYLIAILNAYFARAREIIERYDGLIYQFVGDEIVFQFKDEITPSLSSTSLATACIRDLFEEATLIEKNLPPDANHYFKLKGSFAHGTMRFTQLDEGHALSGLPLIESVRLLSLVDDKSHQVLTFFNDAAATTEGLAFIFDRRTNQLKGFKEEALICRSRDFNSVEWIFESKQWERLTYFRGDAHIVFILNKICFMAVTRESDNIERMLAAMKWHKCRDISPQVLRACEKAISTFIETNDNGLLSDKILSALVSLIGRIVPSHLASESLYSLLTQLMDHRDSRVQATAVVVLSHLDFPAKKLRKKMFSDNNRVASDAIIELAKKNLNDEVYKALCRLLDSADPAYNLSGKYALECILKYYGDADPVFLKANPYLVKMQTWKDPQKAA